MKRSAYRRLVGVTFVELLIVLLATTILTGAIFRAYVAGLNLRRIQTARQADSGQDQTLEREITRLLTGAKLSENASDTTTYFQALSTSGASDLGCERLTFTTSAPGVPLATQASTDDFLTQQQTLGPVGGISEVSFSATAVGSPGGQSGLFERIQTPSDADPTQGGTESVLDAQVQSIGFQFWNGLEWVSTWDTTLGGTQRRLPAAVKVSYIERNDAAQTTHLFVVPIPTSDATAQNPVPIASSP